MTLPTVPVEGSPHSLSHRNTGGKAYLANRPRDVVPVRTRKELELWEHGGANPKRAEHGRAHYVIGASTLTI